MVIFASGSDTPLKDGVCPVCPFLSVNPPTVNGKLLSAIPPGPGVGVAKKNEPLLSSHKHAVLSVHCLFRHARRVANTVVQVKPNWQSASVTQDLPHASASVGAFVGVGVIVGRTVDVGRSVLAGLGVDVGLGVLVG